MDEPVSAVPETGSSELQASDPPPEVSDPPAGFVLALALPAFFTLVYMLHRVFGGRWVDGPGGSP